MCKHVAIFSNSFYCVTMQLGLQAYRMCFPVSANLPGAIFSGSFWPWRRPKEFKFYMFCKTFPPDSHETCFYNPILGSLLRICRIWNLGALGVQDKRPNGTKLARDISWRLIFSGTYLGDLLADFQDLKVIWQPFDLAIFPMGPRGSQKGPWGPNYANNLMYVGEL